MSDETEAPDNPADPRVVCTRILQHHRNTGGRWPADMPHGITYAVDWWLELLEPPSDRWDRPKQVSGPSGDRWVYPYVDRVAGALRRFLRASYSYQRLIVSAAEDGVPWRGEDEAIFRRVIGEHERMREVGLEAYKAEARNRARALYHPEEQTGTD